MLALVVILLAAAPKDCGEDAQCLAAAVETCGPAKVRRQKAQDSVTRTMGVDLELRETYELSAGKDGACTLRFKREATKVKSSGKARAAMVKAKQDVAAAGREILAALNGNPLAEQLCSGTKAEISAAFQKLAAMDALVAVPGCESAKYPKAKKPKPD